MADHHNTPDLEVKCFDCKKEFPTIFKLQTHINSVHTIRPRLTCDMCGLTYASKETLLRKGIDFNIFFEGLCRKDYSSA